MTAADPLGIAALRAAYASGASPQAVVGRIHDAIARRGDDHVWIHVVPRAHAEAEAARVAERRARGEALPLYGLPFAVKDNIDVAGLPTTAGCPDFAYAATTTAPVVQRLLDAGAILIGKTNLDQFATGLVGVRSPYGTPINPFGAAWVPGGSSSGSAVAVAAGLSSFALGTDTAGSGRVPAAFNDLVGIKPTRGLVSARGVVPACRTLDCVSIFSRTVADGAEVLAVAAGYDPDDPYSRPAAPPATAPPWPPRVGVPRRADLEFFGDADAARLFEVVREHWRGLGAALVEIDFAPFRDAARLLYQGAWVAERYAAIRAFVDARPEALHPVTRAIIEGARALSAADAFDAAYALAALRRRADTAWESIDVLLTPTTGTVYSVAAVEADPIRLNANLGHYTNFVNLLDLCAVAVPAGVLPSGVPWGVTLVGPAFQDDRLLRLAARFRGEADPAPALAPAGPTVRLAVCGAHLRGLPLNAQLTGLGGRLERATRTAASYRLYALPGGPPARPGLVRVARGGAAIEVEVWALPADAFGPFVAGIPAPLGIGTVTLEDSSTVPGFLCEAWAIEGAADITTFGGWRAYIRSGSAV